MNRPLFPGLLLPKTAVAALCLLSAGAAQSFAQQNYPPGQKPRLGTRVLNFVRDLVHDDDDDAVYRRYEPPAGARRRSVPRDNGRKYSLDSPPPEAGYTPSRSARPTPPPSAHDSPRQGAPAPAATRKTTKKPEPDVQDSPPAAPTKPKTKKQEERSSSQPPAPASKPAPTKKPDPKPHVEDSPPPAPVKKESKPAPTPPPPMVASNNHGATPRNVTPEPKKQEPPSPAPSPTPDATLTGTKTTKAGLVKSPYAPYNELDVTGLPAGSLAMDPTTGKVFRVP